MHRAIVALILVSLAAPVRAINQDIVDEANAIVEKYKAGDIAGAIEAARLTEAWLLEEQAGGLTEVFRPYEDFTLEIGEPGSASSAMFGGGVAATATYSKDDIEINVTILGNSPMFGMVSGMVGNAMMASGAGMKIIKITSDIKGGVKYEGEDTEVMVPFKGNTLVQGEGNHREHTVAVVKNLDWPRLGESVEAQ